MNKKTIKLIGAAMGNCAGMSGCETAPHVLKQHLVESTLKFEQIVDYTGQRNDIPALEQYFTTIAQITYNATLQQDNLPVIIGGDHSIAIGSWSGISNALATDNQSLGIIWIDAHMDSHTPETSLSGNIHGMPVATLLGYGYTELVNILSSTPKIKPENLILIGIRSYEDSEAKLLAKLGVKIYYNYDVDNKGFAKIFNDSINYLTKNVDKIGLSIDLDGFDPEDIPGVGTPVGEGVNFAAFINELALLNLDNIVAVEIAECNPTLDKTDKTINSVLTIVNTLNT